MIASFLGKTGGTGIGGKILAGMNSNNWFDLEHPWYSIGLVAYIVMVIIFRLLLYINYFQSIGSS